MPGHTGMSPSLRYTPRPFPPPVVTRRGRRIPTPTFPPPFLVYLSTDSFLGLLSQRSTGRGKKYPEGSCRGCSQGKAGSEAAPSRGCPLPGAASPGAASPSRRCGEPRALHAGGPSAPSRGEAGCERDAQNTGAADPIPADTAATQGTRRLPTTTMDEGCLESSHRDGGDIWGP